MSRTIGENPLCAQGNHQPVLLQEEPFRAIISGDGSMEWDTPTGCVDFSGRVICLRCGKPLRYKVEYWRVGPRFKVILKELT